MARVNTHMTPRPLQLASRNGETLDDVVNAPEPATAGAPVSRFRKWFVDTEATWAFYLPTMAMLELGSTGGDTEKVLKSRLIGMAVHASVSYPYRLWRQFWARGWGVTAESPIWQKKASDATAMLTFQAPLYSAMLWASGYDMKQAVPALALGLTFGFATGPYFGKFQDRLRKHCGTDPLLYK